MKRILFLVPLVDIPTITSNLLAKDLLEYMDTKDDLDVDLLWDGAANRFIYNMKTSLKEYNAVFYIGHGNKDKLYGQHLFWSVINKKNIHKVKNAIIVTMACHSGKELASIAIREGARAYIGSEQLIWAHFPEKERNFLRDWRDEFGSYFKAIVDGKSIGEALKIFQEKMDHYIKIYEEKKNYKNFDWYYKSAIWNRSVMKVWGDSNAKL